MRWSVGIIVVCLAMGLAACSNPLDKQPSSARIPTGCGDCEAEVAALVASIEKTPGVEAVTTTRRTTTGVPQAYLRLSVSLAGEDVMSTDIASVIDAVGEAAWHSAVNPLDVLVLDVTLANGYQESDRLLFGADRDTYEQRWGARPDGSEWSPVPEDQRGKAGCERDGCSGLMRDIARNISTVPGVVAVLGADYIADTPTNSSSADITVRTGGADVAEAVAEVVWRSQVSPLTAIQVSADLGDDSFPASTNFQVDPDHGRDHDRLLELWGPRPVEE